MSLDLLRVWVAKAEREARNKGMQNFYYPPVFDAVCHELVCLRPEAYRTVKREFSGRSERSFLKLRSSEPLFQQDISAAVHERALAYYKDHGYPLDGPAALSVDDSKALQALVPEYNKETCKHYLVGSAGQPYEIADMDHLEDAIAAAHDQRADKLRLWTLQIPLPNVPPLMVAATPITSNMNAAQLCELETSLLDELVGGPTPLRIVSLGSDGTVTERDARRLLVSSGWAEDFTRTFTSTAADGSVTSFTDIMIRAHGQVIVIIQDGRHYRKTARSNLFSGSSTLIFANFPAYFEQVEDLAVLENSPLYRRDVRKLDRQDDRAAARLFSSAFMRFIVERNEPSEHGLAVFLFVFGEAVDAVESRTLSPFERIKMARRLHHFKLLWKQSSAEAGYSKGKYYLSPAADDITDIIVNGVLGLAVIYRDHLSGTYPLLPHLHGTQANEHCFGLLRSVIQDFTVADAFRLMPKIRVRLLAACRNKMSGSDYRRTAAGYCNEYMDHDPGSLSESSREPIPDDDGFVCADIEAREEAATLWEFLGYSPEKQRSSPAAEVPSTLGDVEIDEREEEGDEDEDLGVSSERAELENVLKTASNLTGLDARSDNLLEECTYAAASLNVVQREEM